jgi:hypothetical protein
MSARNNTSVAEQQDGLAALADRIREEHQAIRDAACNALRHALDAGDALITAQAQVSSGWQRWLRDNCFLSVRTAQLYVQLAQHRQDIEAEISRIPDLSLRGARRLITRSKTAGGAGDNKSKSQETTASLADLWAAASPEERTGFLDEIALTDLLEVMPASWKIEIERRVVSGLAARFPGAKTGPAIKMVQRLVEDSRLLGMKPAGSA